MEKIMLRCTYKTFEENFIKEVQLNEVTLKSLYRNKYYNNYIGSLRNKKIELQRNVSPVLTNNKFYFWKLNNIMSPTVLEGSILEEKDQLSIAFTFKKRPWPRTLGIMLLAFMIFVLIISCLCEEQLSIPLYVVILQTMPLTLFSVYILHIPQCDKEKLKDKLKSFEV